jgi:membrane fusion protein (multidrug efflux system)
MLLVLAIGGGLAAWKVQDRQEAEAASANPPEPIETITVAIARPHEHRPTTSVIGTVLALQSITLRNEEPGTVEQAMLTPGQVVEPGTLLVALDVSVEEAELRAHEAQAALSETLLARVQRAHENLAVSETEVDRARAERDIALAQIARIKAIIDRKTIRAPFRARVGIADLHPGQYLDTGTVLTTLQGVDDAAHVDFAVAQWVAAGLVEGEDVEIIAGAEMPPIEAEIVAIDARIDPTTRNAMVRARIERGDHAPAPGASVRVKVPAGPPQTAVAVPVSALRKGPGGDHVFVIGADAEGLDRVQTRRVESGVMIGDQVLIEEGLSPGERVAAKGSFKLREGALVAITPDPAGETAVAQRATDPAP